MKKKLPLKLTVAKQSEDVRPEYDFTGGVRGKHFKARLQGYTIKVHQRDGATQVRRIERQGVVALEPDIQAYFPNSKAVNHALRTLISLVPEKRKAATKRTQKPSNGRKLAAKGRAQKLNESSPKG